MMGKHTIEHKNYYGLEYVTVRMEADGFSEVYGPLYSARLIARIDHMVAVGILEGFYPLRGKEVRFIRKTLGLSIRELAESMGVTHPTIAAIENKPDERVSKPAELFLRIYFFKALGIKKADVDELLSEPTKIKPLKISA